MTKTRKILNRNLRRKIRLLFIVTGVLVALTVLLLIFFAERKLATLVGGGLGESFSTQIFAAPHDISAGNPESAEILVQRLNRLGYKAEAVFSGELGRYCWNAPLLKIHLRGFKTPFERQDETTIAVKIGPDGIEDVRDQNRERLADAYLEPELVSELSGPKKVRREAATFEEIPPALIEGVIALEDIRFYSHWGIDPRGVARAIYNNFFTRGALQGGSTITQQLAKNLFLTPERSVKRKILEAILAVYLDLRKSKREILTLYLNQVYFGQDGPVSVAGVKAAAKYYFGKELAQLDFAECATLAGMIRSPYRYNPVSHRENCRLRRDYVLRRLKDNGTLTFVEFLDAVSEPLDVRPAPAQNHGQSDYFIAEVIRRLVPAYGEDALFRYGLKIYTTMDPLFQQIGVEALKNGSHQAAFVCLDPRSGEVLALVGGRDFKASQFNRATQGRRQPGSAFKPFVYGAALEFGFTPASFLSDEKRTFGTDESQLWAPQNYNRVYLGTVTVREAMAFSINAATVDLAKKIGPEKIILFARRMGIASPLKPDLALALGAYEVTPLELTGAYEPFANGGFRIEPRFVEGVLDSRGEALEIEGPEKKSVLDPALSYLLTSLLRSVVEEGTASNLKSLGWTGPAAGKTGTTNEGRDAWFIGFTPQYLAGVWVGDDEGQPAAVFGAKNAVPIWAHFMKGIYSGVSKLPDFERSKEILAVEIDPVSGKLARFGCPQRKKEMFIAGTEPKEFCPLHPGGLKGWFKRLFGSK